MLNYFIRFFLVNKLGEYLLLLPFVGFGLVTAPFELDLKKQHRDPFAVNAIPDIGENQQIDFSNWIVSSPEIVEDQSLMH
ncbi:MAG: hypothetical protein KDC80_29335 [Saprospiraceae bacterium]|nr:hypothetical protein [Saprospiraceae bacterium]